MCPEHKFKNIKTSPITNIASASIPNSVFIYIINIYKIVLPPGDPRGPENIFISPGGLSPENPGELETLSMIDHVKYYQKNNTDLIEVLDNTSQVKQNEGENTTKNCMENVRITNGYGLIPLPQLIKPSLGELLSRCAAADGFSINQIVNSVSKKAYIKSMGYSMPKSNTTIITKIKEFYNTIKSSYKNEFNILKNSNYKFSLSIDEWNSISNKKYVNITIYTMTSKFNLGLSRIIGSPNAINICENVIKRLGEYDLDLDKHFISITTDGASVLKSAFRNHVSHHVLCLNHAIHLAITKTIYK